MVHYFLEGGAFMWPILVTLIFGLAFVIERAYSLMMSAVDAQTFFETVSKSMSDDGAEAAVQVCSETEGPIAAIFHAGLSKMNRGLGEVEKAIQNAGAIEMGRWSRDGTRLASGGRDLTAIVWAFPAGKQVRVFKGHKRRIESVSWRRDGLQLATGSQDGTVKVWEVATAKTLHTLTGHTKPVRGVTWSPDGKILASGSDDHLIKLWDMFHRDQGQE